MSSELIKVIQWINEQEAKCVKKIQDCRAEISRLQTTTTDDGATMIEWNEREIRDQRQNLNAEIKHLAKMMHVELGILIDRI